MDKFNDQLIWSVVDIYWGKRLISLQDCSTNTEEIVDYETDAEVCTPDT